VKSYYLQKVANLELDLEMKQQITLETDRLYLRPYTVDDADRVQSIVRDKRISDMVSNIPHPYPEGGALSWITASLDNFQKGKNIVYAIVSKELSLIIGTISLQLTPDNEAELGYWLGVDYWGKGYCTEAGKALVLHSFTEFGLKRVKARHLTINPNSGKVLSKIGMNHFDTSEGQCGEKFASIEFYEIFPST